MSGKHSKSSKSRSDTAVQGTNDNSIVSKHSMVSLGYFQDDFLQYVVAKKQRRAPLINRGYYIRAKVINHMLTKFLRHPSDGRKKQILSLGAGFDTAYFRLKSRGLLENCVFVEIDFPDLVKRKATSIHHQEKLNSLLEDVQTSTSSPQIVINSPGYKLLGIDLTDLQTLQACMKACDIDCTLPTALLSECVITYMSTKNSSKLIQWCSDYFENAAFITYEQIKPDDAFGRIMCGHFKKIGSPLRGISSYPSMLSQEQRYLSLGWEQCSTSDMNMFFDSLPEEERDRVAALEPFDEFEEWHLKCAHYIVLTAEKGDCKELYKTVETTTASSPQLESPTRSVTIKTFKQDGPRLQRVGHTCSVVDGVAVVTGGFGSSDGKHKRLRDVVGVDIKSGKRIELIKDDSLKLMEERMLHTATYIGKETVLIFGGRTSPTKALDTALLLQITFQTSTCISDSENRGAIIGTESDQSENLMKPSSAERETLVEDGNRTMCLKCKELCMTGTFPCARWRHSASSIQVKGEDKVILFGGRSLSHSVLGDMFILDVRTFNWKKVEVKGSPPLPRHSHSASVYNKSVIISGGLGSGLQPLNSVHILNTETMSWRQMGCNGKMIPRYSHTSHVADNKLWLVGGIMPSVHPPIAATSVDFMDGTVTDYSMPSPALGCDVPCLMLHNHCSLYLPSDNGKIMILGGGGNCFSFGTHLNDTPVHLSVP